SPFRQRQSPFFVIAVDVVDASDLRPVCVIQHLGDVLDRHADLAEAGGYRIAHRMARIATAPYIREYLRVDGRHLALAAVAEEPARLLPHVRHRPAEAKCRRRQIDAVVAAILCSTAWDGPPRAIHFGPPHIRDLCWPLSGEQSEPQYCLG